MTMSKNDKATRQRASVPSIKARARSWDAGSARVFAAVGFPELATFQRRQGRRADGA